MGSTEITMMTKKRRHVDDDADVIVADKKKQRLRKKEQEVNDEEEGGPMIRFNILEGASKISDYAKLCLLVPESKISDILKLLVESKDKMFDWTIVEDEVITDIRNLPPVFGHPIRSLREHEELPKDKTETELLNWLIHGESFYSNKYAIVTFCDRDKDFNGNVVFEVTKEDLEEPFVDAIWEICSNNCEFEVPRGNTYLKDLKFLDRSQYLCYCSVREIKIEETDEIWDDEEESDEEEFDGVYVVDEKLIESLEEWLAARSYVSNWAFENREMVKGETWVRLSQTYYYVNRKIHNKRK